MTIHEPKVVPSFNEQEFHPEIINSDVIGIDNDEKIISNILDLMQNIVELRKLNLCLANKERFTGVHRLSYRLNKKRLCQKEKRLNNLLLSCTPQQRRTLVILFKVMARLNNKQHLPLAS